MSLAAAIQDGVPMLLSAGIKKNKLRPLAERIEHFATGDKYGQIKGYLWGSYPGIQVVLRKLDFPSTVPPAVLTDFAQQLAYLTGPYSILKQ